MQTSANKLAKVCPQSILVACFHTILQDCDRRLELSTIQRLWASHKNLLVGGLGQPFFGCKQFLIELFTGSQTDEFDCDVGSWAQTGKANQVVCKVKYFY